jgi:hypothetical protein
MRRRNDVTKNELNRRRAVGATVAALIITLTPSIASADADLDAARAYGARQAPAQRVDRESKAIPAPPSGRAESIGTVSAAAASAPKLASEGNLQIEAASVRRALQRINEVTNTALAGQDSAGFEFRFNASLAVVKAWLDEAPAASPRAPAPEQSAIH